MARGLSGLATSLGRKAWHVSGFVVGEWGVEIEI